MTTTPQPLGPPVQLQALLRDVAPSVSRFQQALAQMHADTTLRLAQGPAAAFRQEWDRYVRDVLAPAEEARRQIVREALAGWPGLLRSFTDAQQQMARESLSGITASASTPGLFRLLDTVEGWRSLGEAERTATVSAVEEAYRTTPEDDVPEDLVAELEDTLRDFTAAQDAEYLPIEVSRQTFTLFVGTLLLTSLMTLSFSNDTADGVLSKALELSALVGLTMVAAGKAFDRFTGRTDDADTSEES